MIEPVASEAIAPELKAAIDHNIASRALSSDVQVRTWAHRPELALRWLGLLEAMHERSALDGRLRELMRLRIASITGCQVCQVARKSDEVGEEEICRDWSDARFTGAEQAALRYASLFATDYDSIDSQLFASLHANFTTGQVVELCMFVALMMAGGRMTYVLGRDAAQAVVLGGSVDETGQ